MINDQPIDGPSLGIGLGDKKERTVKISLTVQIVYCNDEKSKIVHIRPIPTWDIRHSQKIRRDIVDKAH